MEESPKQDTQTKTPLAYEETPIIEPVADEPVAAHHTITAEEAEDVVPEAARVFDHRESVVAEPPQVSVVEKQFPSGEKPKRKLHAGTIIFVVLLFGLGVWLSSQIRSFFAPVISDEIAVPTLFPTSGTEGITGDSLPSSPSATGSASLSQTMEVISGTTKKAIPGLSYQLPGLIKAPACDSAGCSSQGTNLPGGTRFTVAPRGQGQLLPDFRGAILTDAAGREFTMKQTVIGGISVYEYTGDFTGRTGGGYTFTAIRGVLVPVSETLAIEFNHFAPAGVITDFAKDDVLFNEIIGSFRGVPANVPTPTVQIPSAEPTATSGGF